MTRPRLLDLFCGAGGAAMGYHRAGFDVLGVDLLPQPRYPFPFVRADALEYVAAHGHEYDAIHASPPCQGYSRMRHLPWLRGRQYPLLIDRTRKALETAAECVCGLRWVIENVQDAAEHMRGSVMLCGKMFGLKVYRHRLFLSNAWLWQPAHRKHTDVIGRGRYLNDRAQPSASGWVSLPSKGTPLNGLRPTGDRHPVAGHFARMDLAKAAMGIDWMNRSDLSQAIPPAYTEFIGRQLLAILEARAG